MKHDDRRPGMLRRALVALALGLVPAVSLAAGPWTEKVHPLVLAGAATEPVEFLVVLDEQADLADAQRFTTKEERGAWVVARLREVADRTQPPLLARLAADGVEHRALWIVNAIWARGGLAAVESMAGRTDVRRIDANPEITLELPERDAASATESFASIEWGVQKTKANQVWALGFRGQGVVVGGQDTGYEWSHAAIRDQYRGWNGASASHDYNWHDSIHSGGSSCGANSPTPCDDHDHGTHTMGTMVGDDGGANQIGMAPDARWIGCRNMNAGNGTPVTYAECFQWFVAPTTVAGQNPDPAKSPHVINNSWTCPESEGCEFDTLREVVENTRAAGILVVASAGNAGSDCATVSDPPAIYEAAFSVGATDSADGIASFSSRGPVTVDGSNRLKPEVSAPGVNVRSSVRGGGYAFFSGTSMAGPHVVGLAALIMSARPDLIGQVEVLETIIEGSAFPLTSGQSCGGYSGSSIPNAVFGHGRVDALEALLGDADADGADNLGDCLPVDGTVWGAPDAVDDLRLGNGANATLEWSAPASAGAAVVRYDVVRSTAADDFSPAHAACLLANSTASSVADTVAPGGVFYYLVRARTLCGSAVAPDSAGDPRDVRTCLGTGGG